MPPRLYLTADGDAIDSTIVQHFEEEGFHVTYVSCRGGGEDYRERLRKLAEGLELGEDYAVIAYGGAATECLEHYAKPAPRLAALVLYYPTPILESAPETKFPSQLEVLCHFAGPREFEPEFRSYTYRDAEAGFAESDHERYNSIEASLAWSRTLGLLRKVFKIEVDLEKVWEAHTQLEFETKDAVATMKTMVEEPYVNHIPTLTGGIGQNELFVFYRDFFIPGNPPDFGMKLVSRTVGVDRVVDEMIIAFTHTQEVPWMLPDVPPTNRTVQIALVGVVCIRGGKLYHEHIYWDQASVLVQVGLLDPKLVPDAMRKRGLKQLPVYGAETAGKVLDKTGHPSNELLSSWVPPQGHPGALSSRPMQTANGDEPNGS